MTFGITALARGGPDALRADRSERKSLSYQLKRSTPPLQMTFEPPSKSQRKRQMHALQDLGVALVELNDQQLAAVELPENLLEAVLEARRITKWEGRRRQMQYIGKLMRFVDPEPIRSRIQAYTATSNAQTARLHELERWRVRLLEDENALTELLNAYPQADAAQLRLLIRNTRRERELGHPPKNFRALFKFLSEALVESKDIDECK